MIAVRTDPNHVREWNTMFSAARSRYVAGAMFESQFRTVLEDLGYRDQALEIEVQEADRERRRAAL